MSELKNGMNLLEISGTPTDDYLFIKVGTRPHDCKEIFVFMQDALHCQVPWAKCVRNEGPPILVNLLTVQHVVPAA